MRKALRTASLGVNDMADYLEVSRNTVSSWINGRITPSGQTLRLWSLRCGVPLEWLRTGQVPSPEPSAQRGESDGSVKPRSDSKRPPPG
jgi:transcriptional regulator with XRE-family HTH domain